MIPSLIIGGLVPLTSIDYPDHLAAVVFCQGCGWRCRYCHNPELLPRNCKQPLEWRQLMAFLESRQGRLDAVVFSGGEPTLQPGIVDAVHVVKSLGFKVGVHSAGMVPERLAELLPQIDWIGLDIKALLENYPNITGHKYSGEVAWRSAKLVVESETAHQMRITTHPKLHTEHEVEAIQRRLAEMGAKDVIVQQVNSVSCYDPSLTD